MQGASRCLRLAILTLVTFLGGQVTVAAVGGTEAHAQGVVREIQVVGNRRVEPETVRSYLDFTVGDPYDPSRINASLRSLFETGLFADVQISRQGSVVVVSVLENPVINKVAIEGNSAIDTKTLQGEIRLKSRSVYTRARALADAQRILDVYQRQGRYSATVEPKIIELDQNRVNLVFEINEGDETKVRSINFIGNRAFSDSQLRDIITRLFGYGAREVHMRPACPPLVFSCKFLNFSRSRSSLDLAGRKAILELEGDSATALDEYSNPRTERYPGCT